jgi:hypothetical protein
MGPYAVDKKRLEIIINQVSGKIKPDIAPIPEMAISGSGTIWCYDPSTRRVIRIYRGIKCYMLSDFIDDLDRVLIYTAANDVVLIEQEELIETGFD